jgi:hypothetical protein
MVIRARCAHTARRQLLMRAALATSQCAIGLWSWLLCNQTCC